ncbi:MAG: septum formation initiator family protein [Bacteroidales bacterium]|nr:septum formation initiator family protein [Bacteroidales bacterium]
MAVKNKYLRITWNIIKNKYVATLLIFALLMCFAENNIFVTMRLRQELSELKDEEKRLRNEMISDSSHLKVLRGDMNAIEKYGREVYYLRRANEDVYVFDKK